MAAFLTHHWMVCVWMGWSQIEAAILQDVNDKDENNESLCVRMYKWCVALYSRLERVSFSVMYKKDPTTEYRPCLSLAAAVVVRFEYKGHVCMVFERLGCSLYDYLKNHDYKPFPIQCIRAYAWQLLKALEFIHSIKLIHTDLKPENILLVDDDEERVPSASSPSSASSYGSPNGNASAQWPNGRQWKRRARGYSEADAGRLSLRPPACNAVKCASFSCSGWTEHASPLCLTLSCAGVCVRSD